MLNALRADLAIIKERDPAARGVLEILCCYPGLHALTLHRFSHRLWQLRWPLTPLLARLLSQAGPLAHGHRNSSGRPDRPGRVHRPRHGRGDR